MRTSPRRAPAVAVAAPHDDVARTPFLLGAALIAIVGVAAYVTSFTGAFVMDDHEHIVGNPQIRHLWPLGAVMAGTGRPIVYLTLAINYALGGLDVRGYHVVNLGFHVLAALTLYGILVETFRSPRLRERWGASAIPLAASAALVWVAHPLLTQAVTYVIQRGESLAGLFGLLTLYAVIRGDRPRHGPRAGVWYAAALCACALAMGTKPIAVTIPLAVVTYDRLFLAGSWRELLARRGGWYAGLAATWGLAAYLTTVEPNPTAGFGIPISPVAYAASQPGVILHYVWLAVWPSPLVFDYGWPLATEASAIVPPAIVVGVLIAATLWGLARGSAVACLGAWFFLTLAPSSSVIPIKDVAAEHRMYLPLAAAAVLFVVVIDAALRRVARSASGRRRAAAVVIAIVVVALGIATAQRNRVYASEVSIWSDVLAKRRDNPRAYYALGSALVAAGEDARAVPYLEQALVRQPMNPAALTSLGVAELRLGKPAQALARFDQVIHVDPTIGRAAFMRALIGRAYYNRGLALAQLGRTQEAIESYRESSRRVPGDPEIPADVRIAESMITLLEGAVARCFDALARDSRGRTAFAEVPAKTSPPPLTLDNTYANIVEGRRVGDVRVKIDLTQIDAHIQFEVHGAVPAHVLPALSDSLAAVLRASGAQPVEAARP